MNCTPAEDLESYCLILSTVTHKIIMVDIKFFVIRLHTCTYDNW